MMSYLLWEIVINCYPPVRLPVFKKNFFLVLIFAKNKGHMTQNLFGFSSVTLGLRAVKKFRALHSFFFLRELPRSVLSSFFFFFFSLSFFFFFLYNRRHPLYLTLCAPLPSYPFLID